MSILTLQRHVEAALEVLQHIKPNETLRELAFRVASAVVEADDRVKWVVLVDNGEHRPPLAYGPYASATTARRAAASGHMIPGPRGAMLVAMSPVPRARKAINGKRK